MANILVFGDSIGQGYYDREGGWVDRLKRYFFEQEIVQNWEQSVNVFNICLAGDTTREILKRFECELKPRIWSEHETIIVFAIGINDSIVFSDGRNKTQTNIFKKNLDKILRLAQKYSEKIIYIGLTPIEQEKVDPMPWSIKEHVIQESVEKYDETLKDFCKKNDLPYIYLYDKLTVKDLSDGAHPNTNGHAKIFNLVRDFLEEKWI